MKLLVYYSTKNSHGNVDFAGSQVLTDEDLTYIDVNKFGDLHREIRTILFDKIGESLFSVKASSIKILSIEFVEE